MNEFALPGRMQPPEQPIQRRHRPRPAPDSPRGYEVFRSCLRWEFGFICSFCLLHESQVSPHGIRGSGLFTIEHLELQKEHSELINRYDNVVYACRRCNTARGSTPRLASDGRRLLDPCKDAWSEHFANKGDELCRHTLEGEYTASVYDVNAPVKKRLRSELQATIEEALELLTEGPGLLAELMTDLPTYPLARQRTRLRISLQLQRDIARAKENLAALSAIPRDADSHCRCDSAEHHTLPEWLEAQVLHGLHEA